MLLILCASRWAVLNNRCVRLPSFVSCTFAPAAFSSRVCRLLLADGMVDELVCLACFERVGYDDATIMEKFRYSYKCPSCEAWMLRVHSGKTHTCTACVQAMPDPTPIARVSITNKNRTTYKYAHLDGSVCKPAAYTPPKGTACLDCGDKKGERFDLSPAGDRDPKKAICFTCYNKFRVTRVSY